MWIWRSVFPGSQLALGFLLAPPLLAHHPHTEREFGDCMMDAHPPQGPQLPAAPWGTCVQLKMFALCSQQACASGGCRGGWEQAEGLLHLSCDPRPLGRRRPARQPAGRFLPWVRTCGAAARDHRLLGQVQGQQEPWVGAGRIHREGTEGKNQPPWSLYSRLPSAPGQGQAQIQPLCKATAFEKVCPLLWEGTFAVKSVHGIFIPLIQPRQDLVHRFSRGNAFNKNLMGSGSSAEAPCEFQVFIWSLAWVGARRQAANGLFSVGEVGWGGELGE